MTSTRYLSPNLLFILVRDNKTERNVVKWDGKFRSFDTFKMTMGVSFRLSELKYEIEWWCWDSKEKRMCQIISDTTWKKCLSRLRLGTELSVRAVVRGEKSIPSQNRTKRTVRFALDHPGKPRKSIVHDMGSLRFTHFRMVAKQAMGIMGSVEILVWNDVRNEHIEVSTTVQFQKEVGDKTRVSVFLRPVVNLDSVDSAPSAPSTPNSLRISRQMSKRRKKKVGSAGNLSRTAKTMKTKTKRQGFMQRNTRRVIDSSRRSRLRRTRSDNSTSSLSRSGSGAVRGLRGFVPSGRRSDVTEMPRDELDDWLDDDDDDDGSSEEEEERRSRKKKKKKGAVQRLISVLNPSPSKGFRFRDEVPRFPRYIRDNRNRSGEDERRGGGGGGGGGGDIDAWLEDDDDEEGDSSSAEEERSDGDDEGGRGRRGGSSRSGKRKGEKKKARKQEPEEMEEEDELTWRTRGRKRSKPCVRIKIKKSGESNEIWMVKNVPVNVIDRNLVRCALKCFEMDTDDFSSWRLKFKFSRREVFIRPKKRGREMRRLVDNELVSIGEELRAILCERD